MVSVFIDQWFATRASVGSFHSISFCAAAGAFSIAFMTAGATFSASKLWPASKPIRRSRAMIGWSVRCGGFTFGSLGGWTEYLAPGLEMGWPLGGVLACRV